MILDVDVTMAATIECEDRLVQVVLEDGCIRVDDPNGGPDLSPLIQMTPEQVEDLIWFLGVAVETARRAK